MTDDRRAQLLTNLQSESQATQLEAIKSFASPDYHGDEAVLDGLIATLRDPDDGDAMGYRVRQASAEALGIIGDAGAVQPLIYALHDHSSGVKVSATIALGQIGDPLAVLALDEALNDDNADVRREAVNALGIIGADHEIDIQPIIALLADPEDSVREVATTVIRDLGGRYAYDAVLGALDDPNSTIRGAIVTLLGELGDVKAWERLLNISANDESKWVRGRAESALDKLPKPEAFKRSDSFFGDPDDDDDTVFPVAPPPPADTLQRFREQQPDLPTLGQLRGEEPPAQPPTPPASTTPSTPDADELSVERIEAMIDQLDVRLAKGEISEATYLKLTERWEARLNELRGSE